VGLWRVGAVATGRGADRPAAARKTSIFSVKRNTSLLIQKKLTGRFSKLINKKIRQHLPCTGRFSKPVNISSSMMADIHTYTYPHIYINA
jgi:hypothetical protein